jgi:hypothetical protein
MRLNRIFKKTFIKEVNESDRECPNMKIKVASYVPSQNSDFDMDSLPCIRSKVNLAEKDTP